MPVDGVEKAYQCFAVLSEGVSELVEELVISGIAVENAGLLDQFIDLRLLALRRLQALDIFIVLPIQEEVLLPNRVLLVILIVKIGYENTSKEVPLIL